MRIVVIAPSGAVDAALAQLPLNAQDAVLLVTRAEPDRAMPAAILRPTLRRLTLWADRVLGGSALGRNVVRILPVDAGRRFASAARRSRRLRDELARAELIIVLEREGILTGWRAARSAPTARAVYGLPAARGSLAELRKATGA